MIINNIVDKIREVRLNEKYEGSMIVFIPGKRDSKIIMDKLKDMSNVIYVHSNMSDTDRKRMFEENSILIATNVVESSITLPDVTVVIDSMMSNIPAKGSTSFNKGIKTGYISYDNSLQRRGRAGRVKQGYYFPMITEAEFNKCREKESLTLI